MILNNSFFLFDCKLLGVGSNEALVKNRNLGSFKMSKSPEDRIFRGPHQLRAGSNEPLVKNRNSRAFKPSKSPIDRICLGPQQLRVGSNEPLVKNRNPEASKKLKSPGYHTWLVPHQHLACLDFFGVSSQLAHGQGELNPDFAADETHTLTK